MGRVRQVVMMALLGGEVVSLACRLRVRPLSSRRKSGRIRATVHGPFPAYVRTLERLATTDAGGVSDTTPLRVFRRLTV